MSEEAKPRPACSLPKARNACTCHGAEACARCGWNPEEMERRKPLPLQRGEDGHYFKDVSR